MAISKERLEELIKQGATIVRNSVDWDSGKPMGIDEIKLDNNYKITANNCNNGYFLMYNGIHTSNLVEDLKNLYENTDDYNWHKEFGCIERTEKLELPVWDEIPEEDWKTSFRGDGGLYVLIADKYFDVIKICCNSIDGYDKDYGHATKENYIKACRKAKELFLGKTE